MANPNNPGFYQQNFAPRIPNTGMNPAPQNYGYDAGNQMMANKQVMPGQVAGTPGPINNAGYPQGPPQSGMNYAPQNRPPYTGQIPNNGPPPNSVTPPQAQQTSQAGPNQPMAPPNSSSLHNQPGIPQKNFQNRPPVLNGISSSQSHAPYGTPHATQQNVPMRPPISGQQPMPPRGGQPLPITGQQPPPMRGQQPVPPMQGSQSRPPMGGSHPRPPMGGQQLPPTSGSQPMSVGGPPPTMGPPSMNQTDQRPASLLQSPPRAERNSSPGGLPLPFHGQAAYSHQLGHSTDTPPGLTPSSSEPASQRSSRAPSPIPGQKYDALEGGEEVPFPGPGAQPRPSMQPATLITSPTGLPPSRMGGPPTMGGPSPPASNAPAGMASSIPSNGTMPPGQQAPWMGGQQPPRPGMPQGVASQPPPQMYQSGQAPGQSPIPPTSQALPPMSTQQPLPQPQAPAPQGITGRRQYPQMPPPGGSAPPPMPGQTPNQGMANNVMNSQAQPTSRPNYTNNTMSNTQALNSSFNSMKLQTHTHLNLLQERNLIPPNGVENVKPALAHDYKKVNCHPDIFRCTLSTIPNTQSLLNKARLPLGILIHPFKDLSQLPVIQSSVIVRCRSCRTYINPFVSFLDMRRWKCNLCYRVNELPEEFTYDPVSRSYGEPQRRPEIRSATIEFIAPSEYMLRPPQAAVYLYVLDVSFNAISSGYLKVFCQTLLEELERIPGDSRTMIGFITFDRSLHFYNLTEGLSQPQMMIVSDVDEIFLPSPDGLLVNLHESRELITDLLSQLPTYFEGNQETGSALGPALQAAYKLMSANGGRVCVMQTLLPTVGPGSLKNREDPNERAGKNIQNLGPATDFYKKLSLDCSAQQIAVDLFLLNGQYADLATIGCISKFSGGSVHHFSNFNSKLNPIETDRFEGVLRRYITRKIGFEAVMRIRCTRGLSLHTFHGNFFVRSTDLLSLPNINPDAGYGMQMSIEDTIEANTACFQAALLYTSSKGERRIRVHTLCLPVSNNIQEIHNGADQQAIIGLLAKMAVDKSISQSMSDARDAMINAATDILGAFGATLTSSQRLGMLPCLNTLRLVPLYILAMLKYVGFRIGSSTRLDDRVASLEQCKTMPLMYFLLELYPNLYPVHNLDDREALSEGDNVIPQPPLLHLSSAHIDRHGAYIMDKGSYILLWIGASISDKWCEDVLNAPNFQSIPDGMMDLPENSNTSSELLRNFISYLNENRPFPAPLLILREDSRYRGQFLTSMVEDRTEATMSYYEFLQYIQKEIKV